MAMQVKRSEWAALNPEMVAAAIRDLNEKGDSGTLFTFYQISEMLMAYDEKSQSKPNLEAGSKFLEENKKNEAVQVLPSGLQYLELQAGNGASPGLQDTIVVKYTGTTIDGKPFDGTFDGEPARFKLANMIPGWLEGLPMMKEGGKAKLFIPSDLAYGNQGSQRIPPGSTLIFEVELMEVVHP